MGNPELPPHVRESEWLRERQSHWEKKRYVPQEDLEHFCGDYVPAIMRGAPSDLGFVHVRVTHLGRRSGIIKITELTRWEFDELPEDGLITVIAEGMRREARRIAAVDLVISVDCEFAPRGALPYHPRHCPEVLS
jgi:hypothetical protein